MMPFAENALQNEHALVTGSTRGIGRETAITLARMGADVTVTGRNKEKLEETKQLILDAQPQAHVFVYPADITDASARSELVKAAEGAHGSLSLLVNSAGVLKRKFVDELEESDLQEMMDVNYTSTVLLTQLVYKRMQEQKKGAIVNVSSLSGLRGTPGNSAYSASKFAITGFTQSLALEAIEHGIRVNAVCPGYVQTEMVEQLMQTKAEETGRSLEEQMQVSADSLPSKRMTQPDEVANTIAYLLTDAASNIVGEAVKISGGSVVH
ncbi:SDR family NAD(P)-dependent oxidoreductase [Marinococcus luteus]|uniref:SDR family NAD(P)-dependent oxidoreductase n=1 Tax=Marinococcus luteus TaxID=1122204 RepID=UPI002ACC9497|nr:SDR family oxidoreductase [Marinococcus luteus]MDZ5784407.1 SDR family oxidoreductase [Marinococcus luteus]